MRRFPLLALLLAATAAACAPAHDNRSDNGAAANVVVANSTHTAAICGAGAARLSSSGLCPEQAEALLHVGDGDRPPPPETCQWTVAELPMSGGNVLLYRAARCEGKTTRLDYVAGKPLSHLDYAVSAIFGGETKGQSLIRFARVNQHDANATILAQTLAVIDDPAEKAGCTVRKADIPSWPTDALVVDIPAAQAVKLPQDEVRTACGPLGLDQDSQHYWRAFQGFVWLFDLGQEQSDIDPGSLTLVRKGQDGAWTALPP